MLALKTSDGMGRRVVTAQESLDRLVLGSLIHAKVAEVERHLEETGSDWSVKADSSMRLTEILGNTIYVEFRAAVDSSVEYPSILDVPIKKGSARLVLMSRSIDPETPFDWDNGYLALELRVLNLNEERDEFFSPELITRELIATPRKTY